MERFRLQDGFIRRYENVKPPFGFNGLGELVYLRTYSRIKPDGTNEKWFETIRRVVEGTYNMQRNWIEMNGLGWNDEKAQDSAQEMYERMFTMKFLPPGRGLWAMGSAITEERGCFAALNNCAFITSEHISEVGADPFCFLMDASMLGVGVGFDTLGAKTLVVGSPGSKRDTFIIPDSREGWVESVKRLINSYLLPAPRIKWEFDYSEIRPAGAAIRGFGGVASGPEPLIQLHLDISELLDNYVDRYVSKTLITDIMNIIGRCVVAGNVRRTAEIALDHGINKEYLNLKNYDINPERQAWGWASNNSIIPELGSDYSSISELIQTNGEPGVQWLQNAQDYSRMNGEPDSKDHRASGVNPCGEQTLESGKSAGELCCLVETFPNRHDSLADFKRTLKFAYLYAKTVTLGKTHWAETNRILLRNRRIGCSMSGITQFITTRGLHELREWDTVGYKTLEYYDEVYSDWLCVPRSIKMTSIKPSGSVSLLAGATPGIHYPESRQYIRRMRLAKDSALVAPLVEAGYLVEACIGQEDSTVVVEVPVMIEENIRTASEVSMWEQLSLVAFQQQYWADNQVSCTVTFDPATEGPQIKHALNYFQYRLKGVSFLPRVELGAYEQMPYEAITPERYYELVENLRPINFGSVGEDSVGEKYCDSESCSI